MIHAAALSLAAATALGMVPAVPGAGPAPQRFGLYYSGPPCPEAEVDRTFSQFQVNLGVQPELLEGRLSAAADGRALLDGWSGRGVELLSNASRADWLLDYPLLDAGAGVWGRSIFGPGCAVEEGAFYVEALFPVGLLEGPIAPRLDLMGRAGQDRLREAARRYRRALGGSVEDQRPEDETAGPRTRAGSKLQKAMFEAMAARDLQPWRVRLVGPEDPLPDTTTVDVLLSGADGSTGLFGHISVGSSSLVYNIYPKGSDRGAPDLVPIWDYLFNAQRGHAIRRPTWILRLQGLPGDDVESLDCDMRGQISDIQEGRSVYHPTANNCTIASLKALRHLGFEVARTRYFTRRFPRLAFGHILDRLPGLIASGRLHPKRVELIFIPQVPTRPAEGGAPNRPLRDRGRIETAAENRATKP